MRLQSTRSKIGVKCRLEPGKRPFFYDADPNFIRCTDDGAFRLGTPIEFDAVFAHVFIKDFPYAFIETVYPENININDDVARDIDLGESEVEDKRENVIKFSPENIAKMKWLENVVISLYVGSGIILQSNRLSLWEPYWLFMLRGSKGPSQHSMDLFFDKVKSITDLCALSRLGFSAKVTDHMNRARHFLSNEVFGFRVDTYNMIPPYGANLELELVLEGILYSHQ